LYPIRRISLTICGLSHPCPGGFMARAKYWCFTSYVEEGGLPQGLTDGVTYLVYQREVCPTTNREHYQGYLELESRQRLQGVKRILGDPAAHLEIRKGTGPQAADYAKKEETRKAGTEPHEYGDISTVTPGQRTDLLDLKTAVDEGKSELEIAEDHFPAWAKHYKAVERYKRLKTEARNFKSEVFILAGDTGVGKSRLAREQFPDAYWKPRGNWWCGYEGQETVVIDDFYGWLPWDFLLRLTDRYPLLVETKGGMAQFVAKRIIFTSNKPYMDWYREEIDKAPLERRITLYSWIATGSTVSPSMVGVTE